ncbi:hypothetical protein [Oceanibaculum nanhaiense]|uniref:hypothetical protein n=1 Tax=Oceanibaculum nanhaiense TaxID=1909734 RepID=UPI003F706EB6
MRPLDKLPPPAWNDYSDTAAIPLGDAAVHLADALGDYCSLCEMRLGSDLIVHHKLRQATPETVRKADWPDLLLICHDCHRHMSRHSITPEERGDYLWPDTDPSFTLHGDSPLIYRLRPVPYIIVDGDARETSAREFVFAEANPAADLELQRKAANTIALFQLNSPYYDAASHTLLLSRAEHMQVPCNRLQQRTLAWTKAAASVDRIRRMRALPEARENPGLVELLRQQITHTANAKGNWSVWMTHFWQEFGEKDLLARAFLERPEDNPGFHFPGTHHERLRWEAL